MKRYHILKDAKIVASTATKEHAYILVRMYQEGETHYMLRSEYSIIFGEEEFVEYEKH